MKLFAISLLLTLINNIHTQECGKRPIKIPSHWAKREAKRDVVGGETSSPYSWPWMVSLHKKSSISLIYQCGGTIFKDRFILTAAHCFDSDRNPSNFLIKIGGNKRNEGINYGITKITIHPQYQSGQYYNDIAILKLNASIPNAKIVCMPSDKETYNNKNIKVLGWGDTSFAGRPAEDLQEATINVIPIQQCNESYTRLKASSLPNGVTSRFLCAGLSTGGKDACQGDSGGPLLMDNESRWKIIGIVSFGYQCAKAGFPGVYTKVASYLSWISSNSN